MTVFNTYIGIDYSGAKASVSRLRQLQIYESMSPLEPVTVQPFDKGATNWCRKEVARYMKESLLTKPRIIVGIDHGLSFPSGYFNLHKLKNWDEFLNYFSNSWQMDRDHMYVDFIRNKIVNEESNTDYRLCERWVPGTKSVFHFDVQGSVAKSTHAGLPWIRRLRNDPAIRARTHFWPFDGFRVAEGKSVVAEIFPSLFRRRYKKDDRTDDQHDAYVVSAWLREMDVRGALVEYFNPPLTLPERQLAQLEGWILGVR